MLAVIMSAQYICNPINKTHKQITFKTAHILSCHSPGPLRVLIFFMVISRSRSWNN